MSDERIADLVGKLGNFRARGPAMQQLVAAGAEAVGPLLDALESGSTEGARWAIIRCLGQLRARQAAPRLAPLLDDSRYRSVAHDALIAIAGKDVGPTSAAWLRWAGEGGGDHDPRMHATESSDQRLMELAVAGSGAALRSAVGGRQVVEVPLSGGQRQEVTVNLGAKDPEGSAIVIVHADCGAAAPEHHEYALRRNLRMPYGALAVRDAGGGPRFVMFNTLLRDALSPLELKKSILTVAERAASVRADLESGRPVAGD